MKKNIIVDTSKLSWYFMIEKNIGWNIITTMRHQGDENTEPQSLQVPYALTPLQGLYTPSEKIVRFMIGEKDLDGSYILYAKEAGSKNGFLVDKTLAKVLLGITKNPKGFVTYDDLLQVVEKNDTLSDYHRTMTLFAIKEHKAIRMNQRTFTLFYLKGKYTKRHLEVSDLHEVDRSICDMLTNKRCNFDIKTRKGSHFVRIILYKKSKKVAHAA